MSTIEVTVSLDTQLHAKARAIAKKQERTLKGLIVALVTDLVKEDRLQRAKRELYKPYVDRPTLPLAVKRRKKVKQGKEPSE